MPSLTACVNGRFLPAEEAVVSIHDRGFLFGDAVFETARLHRGRFFRLAEHLERFAASAATLRIPVPAADEIASIAERLARHNQADEASFRITVSRAGAAPSSTVATLQPMPADWRERARRGWRVITAHTRRPGLSAVPAQLKSTGRPYALIARLEAEDAGVDDALLLSSDGCIAEGPAWNVFWIRGDTLFTPALDVGVLEGITRRIIMQLAADLGLATAEIAAPRDALDDADEILASMTSLGVVPFREFDGRPLSSTVALRLHDLYWQCVHDEVAAAE
jgi:branched-chain amino acid aminotransferase